MSLDLQCVVVQTMRNIIGQECMQAIGMNGATADLICEENRYPEPLAAIGFRPERALFHRKLAVLFIAA